MEPFLIKTEAQYAQALEIVAQLMDAEPGSADEAALELWGTLIELYEEKAHPIPLPDPIAAIRFRMEQQGLSRSDLVQYIGSQSKVSEVLSGKRPLSLPMMRRLHAGLGIPADALMQEPGATLPPATPEVEWQRFPVVEMRKRGWIIFEGTPHQARANAEAIMREYMAPFDEEVALPMCARQHIREGSKMDRYALCAWKLRILHLVQDLKLPPYEPGMVSQDFIREVIRLSYFTNGVALAQEYLAKSGIMLITEEHLSRTYLDGAALMLPDGNPLIALTLRYDRLDNFWLTLAHELAHVALHLDGEDTAFFDDLESSDKSPMERDADRLAAEALIPSALWSASGMNEHAKAPQVRAFAQKLRISPAIPAGRIRHEANNHKLLWSLVGKDEVRCVFEREPSA
jgi:HTH-type transcriptional regulator/antitoxin HigA